MKKDFIKYMDGYDKAGNTGSMQLDQWSLLSGLDPMDYVDASLLHDLLNRSGIYMEVYPMEEFNYMEGEKDPSDIAYNGAMGDRFNLLDPYYQVDGYGYYTTLREKEYNQLIRQEVLDNFNKQELLEELTRSYCKDIKDYLEEIKEELEEDLNLDWLDLIY